MLPHEAHISACSVRTDITPTSPVPMSGYGARSGLSTGVNDPLSATALVLDDGATTIAIVSIDVLNVSRELTRGVWRTLEQNGLHLDDLLLAATHTHAGPYVPSRALDASPVLRSEIDVSASLDELQTSLVEAITDAYEGLETASIRVGHAQEETVPVNRRAEGGVGGNVRLPDGPIDPNVTALLVETNTGNRTLVYSFACHPVCTTGEETLLSADWPGYARNRIEAEHPGIEVLYLNGAAGDINPRDAGTSRSGADVYEYMEYIGSQVGDAALRALADTESGGNQQIERSPIRIDSATVTFPVKATPPVDVLQKRIESLESTLQRLEADGDETGYAKINWDKRYAEELLAIAEWDATCLPNRLPYVTIGDLGILGMPGEVLVRHGLELRDSAAVSTLIPAGYVNDYVGYLPTLADLENIGYEVRTMKLAPEAIVEFREKAMGLVAPER
ncbi:neutral/alkaline non-lysosomal ceramidase N-terminal domain-containing protein [Halobacteria archaeon AArc-curdl1]|uniref:Neutral/alkaline non-lysosomal ceramidase N-terminal domain-containing protein n=1 Tax=Natronosalvus hydrolyticus TaxID=2979988 RepID=A0AAP3E572_9EURY|nr:neutral/alkaline non-lysosomal ceramidase N-terminal domain-containing protein [Halobacteria archaeon AArc-curdl1]